MAKFEDLDDVTISNPKVGDVVKYTATGWQNGADATGTPPGGNPCGELDDFLRRSIDEEITGTYTWIGNDGESKIIVESPTETTQLTGGSVILTDKASGESGRIQITNDANDLMLRSNNQLMFKDSTLTEPVSLAELVACCDDGDGGGSTGSGVAPIIHDFTIDEALCDSSDSVTFTVSGNAIGAPGKSLRVIYADMDTKSDVMVTTPKTAAMPSWATAALVFFQTNVQHRAALLSDTGTSSNRSCHTAHRLVVSGATFVDLNQGLSRNDYMSSAQKSIIYVNNIGAIDTRIQQRGVDKLDVIEFPAGANVTFQAKMAVQKGARCDITVNSGRMIIIPFVKQANSIIYGLAGAFATGESGLEDNIMDDLLADSPDLTPAEKAVDLGRDLRSEMRHAITALDSRKLHPPSGSPKTIDDYEAQIGLLWSLLDSSNLLTYQATIAALDPIFEEISKPEYGVADLFQFEIEAGATTRSLF